MTGPELTSRQVVAHDRQRELGPDGERALAGLFGTVYPAGGTVLDAGGGSGVAVPALRAAGLGCVLLDLSVAMLAAAAGRRVPRIRGDLRSIPLAAASVDGVHAAYVVQNIPQWRDVGAEFARVLRPGGAVLFAFGAPPADPIVSELSRRYFAALQHAGARRAGVRAEATGLRSVPDAARELSKVGLSLVGEHTVTGEQTRSLTELVRAWSANPFAVDAAAPVRAAAETEALTWATTQGDPDQRRTMPVRHVLHEFRRT